MERYTAKKRVAPKTAFKPGMKRAEGAGRKPGQRNKTTVLIKDAISGAAEELGMLEPIFRTKEVIRGTKKLQVSTGEIIGWKPTGKGGTQGYMVWLGCTYPKAFASLIGRMIPLQIDAKVDTTNRTVSQRFSQTDLGKMSLTEKMAAMREMIGLTKPLAPPDPNRDAITDAEFSEVEPE
jgi:hypothetical protein